MDRDPFTFRSARPGSKSNRRKQRGFVQPRQVEDHWSFYKKSLYVVRPGHHWPAWLLPLLILALILALVFWAAPTAIRRIRQAQGKIDNPGEDQSSLLYDAATWAVNKPAADVFSQDDLKASRLSQALFNEPVKIISRDCAYGFIQIRLRDGLEGYMLIKDLTDSRASIEPDLFRYKLVIAAASKRIMSHASRGTLLVEVLMGTVLFADYRGNGISRIRLPDGSTGWLSDDGVIVLPPLGQVGIPLEGARYFCNTAMAFNQITVLQNGQSILGVSTVGIARQAAAVNGVTLPRTLAGLAGSGQAVALQLDKETGLADLGQIKAGDLVFFADARNPAAPGDLAICVGDGLILYARPSQSSIQLIDLDQNEDLRRRILLVRRIFKD